MDTLSLTYAELAERLGIEREAARQLVKRKRWHKWKGNDGQLKVSIPEEALSNRSSTGLRPDDETGAEPVDNRIETGVLPVLNRHIERLEAQLNDAMKRAGERDELVIQRDVLTTQVEALRAALTAAERDRDRWHEAAMVKPEPAAATRRLPWWRRLAG